MQRACSTKKGQQPFCPVLSASTCPVSLSLTGAGHEETGGEGGGEVGEQALWDHAPVLDGALDLVVARHLGAVQHHGTHDISLQQEAQGHTQRATER